MLAHSRDRPTASGTERRNEGGRERGWKATLRRVANFLDDDDDDDDDDDAVRSLTHSLLQ